MQLIVYSEKKSTRLKYILQVFLKQLGGVDYQWVSDTTVYQNSKLAKINYSTNPIVQQEIFIPSTSLLFEENIKFQSIKVDYHEKAPIFFQRKNTRFLPFDVFAASFYLLSRYEEYLPSEKDEYGRFRAKESLAFKNKFLHLPVINLWNQWLQKELLHQNPQLKFSSPKYQFQPTYDIDYAWAYKNKGWFRSLLGYSKALAKVNFKDLKDRFRVQNNWQIDPFFTFEYLDKLHQQYHFSPIWFFLLADYGKFDKNNPVTNIEFQELIKSIARKHPTGIHPSYQSNQSFSILKEEKTLLEEISNQKVTKSRQHFLKLTLPQTYQHLIKLGIQEDYSMGYAAEIGFRASIAQPFDWYDLENEKITDLKIHPFQIMDGTLKNYLKLTPQKAIEESEKMIEIIKSVGGTFISLWHNSSFSSESGWQDWGEVYEAILKKGQQSN